MSPWINVVLQGVMLGGLYALFASGLSLSFGVMRMINFAHGDLIVFASYVAYVITNMMGFNPFWSFYAVVPIMALFGYLLQRFLLNRTLGDDLLRPLLVTFGLSILIQNLLMEVFSANSKGLQAGVVETASIPLGGDLALGVMPLVIMLIALCLLGGLQYVFHHTALGRAFRATSDDQRTVQLMGVDNQKLYSIATAIAFAIIGVAGLLMAIRTNFDPSIGPSRLLFAFEAVIIGGAGSLWGTLIGGIVLGVAQSVGSHLDPGWGTLCGHLVFLVLLLVKPTGLFPKTNLS